MFKVPVSAEEGIARDFEAVGGGGGRESHVAARAPYISAVGRPVAGRRAAYYVACPIQISAICIQSVGGIVGRGNVAEECCAVESEGVGGGGGPDADEAERSGVGYREAAAHRAARKRHITFQRFRHAVTDLSACRV